MDEAEIIHAEKLERLCITLMNRALNPDIDVGSPQYFSVQAEREIWPIGCFRVPKETHSVLSWVFDQTSFPTLIKAQNGGQLLVVDGVGSFKVNWHLSCDMKTIKCLYGLKGNANMSCIYCNQQKCKTLITTEAQALAAIKRRPSGWSGGLQASNIPSKPVSDVASLSRWKPIFPIPLECVHICTLHALNRICEKILHLHFQYIWTIRDSKVKAEAIADMERLLSSTGMHGGMVKNFKDAQLSGKQNNVPNKPSLSGAHTAKLFRKSSCEGTSDRLWRDIVLAERNCGGDGNTRRERMEVWSSLERLLPFFTGLTLTTYQVSNFDRQAMEFGKIFVKVYGEHNVTHYIVSSVLQFTPWNFTVKALFGFICVE